MEQRRDDVKEVADLRRTEAELGQPTDCRVDVVDEVGHVVKPGFPGSVEVTDRRRTVAVILDQLDHH